MIELLGRHRTLVLAVTGLAIAAIVFVVVWFQPQKVFIEDEVNEAAPTAAAASASPAAAIEGSFESFEHPTSGTAIVVETGDERVLRFEDFETSNGPDLVVWLSTAYPRDFRDDTVAEDFVDLGQLKGNVGAQNYVIPAGTDLGRYDSVIVWCRRFKVSFGAARLA